MRLFKALVLPIIEYGAPVLVSALTECCKEFGKIQRWAMVKASGCLSSTRDSVWRRPSDIVRK